VIFTYPTLLLSSKFYFVIATMHNQKGYVVFEEAREIAEKI